MKNLKDILKTTFISTSANEMENYIVEGLNIDTDKKTVSLTDDHDRGVDFSLVNNPIYSKYKGYNVISIFKRTKLYDNDNVQRDGNPFIYALKEKYNWKFNITDVEIKKYIKQFLETCDKINSSYDTIIITPSSSNINEKFMKIISKQVNSKNIINEFFLKMSIEEIVDNDLIDKEAIQNDYPKEYNKVIMEIHKSFRKMKGKYFEAKSMTNKDYLKYIKYIGVNTDENVRNKIDGKDILLLDDIISSGETISQCIEGVISNFEPKSITIITLLSQLNE